MVGTLDLWDDTCIQEMGARQWSAIQDGTLSGGEGITLVGKASL
jgi:hypothetical protein